MSLCSSGIILLIFKPRKSSTITDAAKACKAIGIKPQISDLVVDGGNVVRLGQKAIMTERVYRENPSYRKEALGYLLKDLLKVKELIIIPEEPGDPFGHADGCVRFVNERNVVINEPIKEHLAFDRELRRVLKTHRLEYVKMPYFIDNDLRHKDSAVGNYVNYLQVWDLIIVPAYDGYADQNRSARKSLQFIFGPGKDVIPLEATSIAEEGGVLNCVSWNKAK